MADVILFKPIRPSKFRKAEIWYELQYEINKIGKEIEQEFNKTTNYWKHKPSFAKETNISNDKIEVLVGTDDEIYRYVNDGAKDHIIVPVKAPFLVFQTGKYHASTTPGSLISKQHGRGGKYHRHSIVHHPGIKARKFDEQIKKRWEKKFNTRIEKAIKRGIKKTGYAM